MNKIDTVQWKQFRIKEIFEVKRPSARSQATYESGDIAFVASGNYNNGVLKYLSPKDDEILDKGNCITVSPIDGSSFYQPNDFLGRGGAGSSIILLYNGKLNLYSGTFIATIIRKVCSKYLYSDMANKDTIANEIILLPVDENMQPNFLYMESYMKNQEIAVRASLSNFQSVKQSESFSSIDTMRWGYFSIDSLFEVKKGTRLVKADMKEGNIPFVGASSINNGITSRIANDEHLHKSNTITITYNGSVGEAFYQDYVFWASDDVNVLYPKFNMNKHIALFLIPILKAIGKRYAFIDKWKKEDMERDNIKLPIDKTGNPDFLYMEKYMKKLEGQVKNNLQLFNKV